MGNSQQYIFPLFNHNSYPVDNFINSSSNQAAYDIIVNWSNYFSNNIKDFLHKSKIVEGFLEETNSSTAAYIDVCEEQRKVSTTKSPTRATYAGSLNNVMYNLHPKDKDILNTKTDSKWGFAPYEYMVLIYGPPSSGKTYLTKIWQNLSNAYLITKDLEILDKEIIKKHVAFIIDDIEFMEERKLLHSFNIINETPNKYLLMTTKNLRSSFFLPDLISRINTIRRIELKQPDDELIKQLIFKHFSDHSIKIAEQVINYLLINLPRRFDQLIKLLSKITDFALLHQHAITIPLIKNTLKEWGE